jgi:hypothetical protein
MADQQPEGKNLKEDFLVEKLRSDPSQNTDVRIVTGYLGKGAQEGYWRLYISPQLNEYLEISEEDIVHNQSLATEQSPLGGTVLWIKSSSNLQYTRTISRQVQAEFLQGDMTASFLSGGPTRFDRLEAANNPPPATGGWVCVSVVSLVLTSALSVIWVCTPATAVATVVAADKETSQVNCPSVAEACPTRVVECFVPISPLCETATPVTLVTIRPELCPQR